MEADMKERRLDEVIVEPSRVAGGEDGTPADAKQRSTVYAGRLVIDGERVYAWTPYAFKDRCKSVPGGRWDAERRAWFWRTSDDVVLGLDLALPRSVIARDVAFDLLLDRVKLQRDADQVRAHLPDEDVDGIPLEKLPSWAHQRRAFWKAWGKRAAMLAMDMGTGKSKVAVDLVQNRDDRSVLILCPRSVVGVWPREFERHAVARSEWHIVTLDTGSSTRNHALAIAGASLAKARGQRLVVVVNYESAWRTPVSTWLTGREWDTVICDESHRIKSATGKASKFAATLTGHARHRLALSGTPMAHTPLDVFAQYRFLDPAIFGASYYAFKHRYGRWGGYGGYQLLGLMNEDDLNRRFYSIAYRVGAEVLDLPVATHSQRDVILGPAARKAYSEMFRTFVTWVKSGDDREPVTVVNALGKLLRLQQITSGFLPGDETRDLVQVDTAKEETLADVLEDLDEPVVVFCRFRGDLDAVKRVCEKQGRRYGELSGRDRSGLGADARMATDIDVLGAQIQSGGVGIDLTRARVCIYYSVGFSLSDYQQSLARVHRPGQSRSVTYVHLVAPGTVDETVYQALSERRDAVEAILREVQ